MRETKKDTTLVHGTSSGLLSTILQNRDVKTQSEKTLNEFSNTLETKYPVSYTHLDVYKRQPLTAETMNTLYKTSVIRN